MVRWGAGKEREGGGLRWKGKEGGCCEVKAVAGGGWDWARLGVGVGS